MRKPYIKRGPAAQYANEGEQILELGNGTGKGCLISIRNNPETGEIILEPYELDGVELRGAAVLAAKTALLAAKRRESELLGAVRYLFPRVHRHLATDSELDQIRDLVPCVHCGAMAVNRVVAHRTDCPTTAERRALA